MAQRPTVRTDSSEQRGHTDEPPPVDAPPSKQRSGQALDPLAIRVSGVNGEVSPPDPDFDQLLKLIAEQACLATSATASAIALKHQDEIICRATSGPNVPDLGVSLNVSSGLSGACVRTREAQYCEDTETDPRVNAEACRRLQVRSVLVVPLLRGEELLGVFEIFSPFPQAFARHDLQNLEALSNVILDTMQAPAIEQPSVAADPEPSPPPSEIVKPVEVSIPPAKVAVSEKAPLAREVVRKEEAPPVGEREREAAESPEAWIESIAAHVEVVAPPPEVRVAPSVRPSIPVAPPVVKADPPAFVHTPQVAASRVRRAEVVAPVERVHEPSARTESFSPAPSPILTVPERPRDWISTALTVSVVGLAVVLGWMLGRVGWERTMGSRAETTSDVAAANQSGAPSVHASSNAADADPIVVEPTGRSTPSNPASGSSRGEARASRQPESQPGGKANPAGSGGLVVYQNGKVIFQQTVPGGPERSVSSSIGGNSGEHSSAGDPPEVPATAVSSEVASAHLVQRIEPVYPEEARQQFIQGEVVLEAVVGKDGGVRELKLISGDSALATAAAAAVQQWRFRPFEEHGKAVAFSTRLTVNFRLH